MTHATGGPDAFLSTIYSFLESDDLPDLPDLIRGEQERRGLGERQTARILGVGQETLARWKNGEAKTIDYLSMVKICNFVGRDFADMARVMASSMSPEDVRSIETSRARNYVDQMFDLKELRSMGFIKSHVDLDAAIARIKDYFGLESIYDYSRVLIQPLLSSTKRGFSDKMRAFWIASARAQFMKCPNPNEFDREALMRLLPQVREYTVFPEKGLLTVARALYSIGITVICQSYLRGTQVRGATFVIDGKPCIVLTDYNKNLTTVWFALLHELAHCIYHWDNLTSTNYHLSGEPDLFLIEPQADYVAREMLLSEDKRKVAATIIDNEYAVVGFAREHKIHPGVVYSLVAHDTGDYSLTNNMKESPERAIQSLRVDFLGGRSVEENVTPAVEALSA